jgi:hypothetical protein
MPAKKAIKKTAVKKVAAKKVSTKKTAVKKAVAKKTTAKKVATPKKSKASVTRISAKVDVRFGNTLFIRGEGGGLSWTIGTPMKNLSEDDWTWETKTADSGIVFKFLINDEIWANGDDLTVASGGTSISTPTFY